MHLKTLSSFVCLSLLTLLLSISVPLRVYAAAGTECPVPPSSYLVNLKANGQFSNQNEANTTTMFVQFDTVAGYPAAYAEDGVVPTVNHWYMVGLSKFATLKINSTGDLQKIDDGNGRALFLWPIETDGTIGRPANNNLTQNYTTMTIGHLSCVTGYFAADSATFVNESGATLAHDFPYQEGATPAAGWTFKSAPVVDPPPDPTPTPNPSVPQDLTPRDLKLIALGISLFVSYQIINAFKWRNYDA
jgi:hypothetical protein